MKPFLAFFAVLIIGIAGYYAFGRPVVQSVSTGDQSIQEQTGRPATAAKINIDAVCEGALAYMTFPDGEASAKFVAECKEGKHPEVIEKYKSDMNLGAGAQI